MGTWYFVAYLFIQCLRQLEQGSQLQGSQLLASESDKPVAEVPQFLGDRKMRTMQYIFVK